MSEAAPRIAILPPELANQIAAGEVVERPASVAKELIENSLDADASSIRVRVEGGGRRLIEVRDDGSGMTAAEAQLSLERHATSKLKTVDDLESITTLGFRGEALPSIASVSRLTITTRPESALSGTEVRVIGGQLEAPRPAACPVGTEVSVRDLFFNTPARLKFLKTESTERRHIAETVIRAGLARPDLHLVLEAEGRTVIEAPPSAELVDRAVVLLGGGVADALYPIAPGAGRGEVVISGLFGSPKVVRRSAAGIYTFVNGRYIRDRRVQAAISVAYGTLVEKGRYPNLILYIHVPPDRVDVNVHPMKTEVRFHEADIVFRAVRGALLDGLMAAPWVPRQPSHLKVYRLDDRAGEPADLQLEAPRPPPPDPVQQTLDVTSRLNEPTSLGGWWASGPVSASSAAEIAALDGPDPVPPPRYFSTLAYIGKLGDLYLVCRDHEGMVVVDQHAAHERITFERLKGVYVGAHRETQALLLPVQLDLNPVQAETLREHGDFLAGVGFEVEPFGRDTFILRSVPALLRGARYESLIRDALDEIGQHGHTQSIDDAVDAVLSRMACHASVRAGDRLNVPEVDALLAQMDEIDFRGNCPHGRPVFFRLSWVEIEKRFERR